MNQTIDNFISPRYRLLKPELKIHNTMLNIKKIEEFLKDAIRRVTDETGAFDAALLDNYSEEEYDSMEFEDQLVEIELTLADIYPETPYYVYLMVMITKIKEIYGVDSENIDEDYLLPDEDFVLDFPDEEYTDEDREFEANDDHCLDFLFE